MTRFNASPGFTTLAAALATDATSAAAPVRAQILWSQDQLPAIGGDTTLVSIEVLLDRAHFSPGAINGANSDNLRKAIRAYQQTHQLPPDGSADAAFLQTLTAQDQTPALVSYVITDDDVRGPFVRVPRGMAAQSHLRHLGYQSATEELAEKFHMDQHLLTRLNPNADFDQAGATILVANVGGGLPGPVASIVIDKREKSLRALDSGGNVIAFFPVTVGGAHTPTPSGDFTVANIDFDHVYRFRPDQLPAFHNPHGRPFDIASGPNNPTGAVWIALSRPTYGIHGSPEPSLISKTHSHGCVRLTNWDALTLAQAVQPGVPVSFRNGEMETASAQ